ncbi:hypothetical protein KKE54_07950 [bacterium]|jgi:hypothetical protein|nr:hypothetical protein [bacterium]
MKKLLDWIDRKRAQYGSIVVLLAALALFTVLALILALVYAFFIGLAYINPYLVLLLTALLLVLIIYKNRSA